MKITRELLDTGFDFYGLEDEEIKAGCRTALDAVLSDDAKTKSVEDVTEILFDRSDESIGQLLHKRDNPALFGFDLPYLSTTVLLLGAKRHITTFNTLPYDAEQIAFQKERVRSHVMNVKDRAPMHNLTVVDLVWSSYFASNRLIQIGRLQFGPFKGFIKIHIPRGKDLKTEDVLDSIRASLEPVKGVFRTPDPVYRCSSWLLSPQLPLFLKEGSNILRFQSLFTIEQKSECRAALMSFLFCVPNDTLNVDLPENTSLQRAVKRYLLEGNTVFSGAGNLRTEVFDPSFTL